MKICLGSQLFNLDFTLCCGQTFRWENRDGWWYGVVKEKAFKIRQTGDELEFENVEVAFVKDYFGLDEDLLNILLEIGRDEHVKNAAEAFKGLRIVRQDPWECLISYICATYKSIPAIKKMIFKLSSQFGKRTVFEGQDFHAFPSPAALANASVEKLESCGLGYRARYVLETARKIDDDAVNLEKLKRAGYEEARSRLLELSGVGLKVADCILLFSLDKKESFPVDVWIKRAVVRHYADHFPKEFIEKISAERSPTSQEYKTLNLFGRRYFGRYAGYAQEYLYHCERNRNSTSQS
jgi:N-glycosylase/DNA lyase